MINLKFVYNEVVKKSLRNFGIDVFSLGAGIKL